MKRAIRWTLIIILTLSALGVGAMLQQQNARHADASALAITAATSDADVRVEAKPYLTFRPLRNTERMGMIVYPGAYVDVRGYAPVLRRIAAEGYRVIVVPMPFDLAILAPDRALEVEAANADIQYWVIAGHSVGGAAGALFANRHPDSVAGVVIWDSYPPSTASLADFSKPVWHIHRATPDGAPPPTFAQQRGLFPANSRWVAIPGGIHMNFGSFSGGGYQEDWAPSISQEQQHNLVVAGTLQALADIEHAVAKQ